MATIGEFWRKGNIICICTEINLSEEPMDAFIISKDYQLCLYVYVFLNRLMYAIKLNINDYNDVDTFSEIWNMKYETGLGVDWLDIKVNIQSLLPVNKEHSLWSERIQIQSCENIACLHSQSLHLHRNSVPDTMEALSLKNGNTSPAPSGWCFGCHSLGLIHGESNPIWVKVPSMLLKVWVLQKVNVYKLECHKDWLWTK